MESTVWVTQSEADNKKNKKNFKPLQKYGRIKFVTEHEISPKVDGSDGNSAQTDRVMVDLQKFTDIFDPVNDLLCLVGNPLTSGALLACAQDIHPVTRTLKWDNREFHYDEVTIDMSSVLPHEGVSDVR